MRLESNCRTADAAPAEKPAKKGQLTLEQAAFWIELLKDVLTGIWAAVRADMEGKPRPAGWSAREIRAGEAPEPAQETPAEQHFTHEHASQGGPEGKLDRGTGDAAPRRLVLRWPFAFVPWKPPAPGSLDEHFAKLRGLDPRTGRPVRR
jgi:hypothetical protein